jgi:hypothetical protein
MPMNQVLLRRSLCDNPHLMQHITLFATGLGDDIKDCAVVSSTANAGNGNVLCTVDVQAAMQNLSRKVPAEYNQFEVRVVKQGTMPGAATDQHIGSWQGRYGSAAASCCTRSSGVCTAGGRLITLTLCFEHH